jgi:glycine cleavage system H protein
VIIVRGCEFPEDRCYHAEYNVWIKKVSPDVLRIGATSFGVALAVEFVAFMPKPLGTRVTAGKAVGLLEIMKTIISVRTPVSGSLCASNDAAVEDPARISADPYETGWLVDLRIEAAAPWTASLVSGKSIRTTFEEAMRLENFEGADR